jgi:transposase
MMPGHIAVYLAVGRVDLRGAFDRLAAVTREVLRLAPNSGALFIFLNGRRNRLKALWWDRNGYVILYKRLTKGSFKVPVPKSIGDGLRYIELSPDGFRRLLAAETVEPDIPPTLH